MKMADPAFLIAWPGTMLSLPPRSQIQPWNGQQNYLMQPASIDSIVPR